MKRLTESPVPEPKKYDERFCSGKRVHLLRKAYTARNPPRPPEKYTPWFWDTGPWADGTSLAVPTRRRRSQSMITRACNAQDAEWYKKTHWKWMHKAFSAPCKPWKMYKDPDHFWKRMHLFKPKDMNKL
jgi:hypothetical protein